jgi:hypothetical protein
MRVLEGKYEITAKVPGRFFNHPTLGKIDLESINEFTAKALAKKGYLKEVTVEEPAEAVVTKPKKRS